MGMVEVAPKLSFRRSIFGLLIAAALALGLPGCNSPGLAPGRTDGAAPGSGPMGPAPDRGFGLPDAAPDKGPVGDACSPVTCMPAGGKYCGKVGDGCGGELDCGGCSMGETCGGGGVDHVCGRPAPAGCQAIACQQAGGRLCGRVGDGCGRGLECGACPAGQTCGQSRICIEGRCEGLCLQQKQCPGGAQTTLTGTVFAPTPPRFGAADPLYNVRVYVPNAPLAPFAPGVACERCEDQISGSPLVTTLSGPDGKFVLRDVPAGNDIPLVLQIGRWRRRVVIPQVPACTTTALPPELTRLPRNQQEGDIPRLAIATGAFDPIECLLRKIGIEDQEFTLPTGTGRVHMFRQFGSRLDAGSVAGSMLTGDAGALARYDMVLLPCDSRTEKSPQAQANLVEYAGKGGRLFLTDWSDTWLRTAPGFEPLTRWLPAASYLGDEYQATVDQSFPKGQAFAQWLQHTGAAVTGPAMDARLPIHDIYMGGALAESVQAPTQRWLYTDAPRRSVQHFTFNTPVGTPPDRQCGRVVYSNFHVVPDPAAASPVFPGFCAGTPMSPQEKALEFMLFDAAACVQPDAEKTRVFEPPPLPPPAPPPTID